MVLATHTTKNKDFKTYIMKVLKQVHPDTRINEVAKQQLAGYLDVVTRSVVKKAHELLTLEGKKTFKPDVVQNAIRISIPGELAKHAVALATKASAAYVSTLEQKEKGKPRSKTSRAGLKLSVSLIRKYFQGYSLRISDSAPVYLAAIIEYIMSELLESSGNVSRDAKAVTIKNRHLFVAIQNDSEFLELTRRNNIIMLGAGVIPDAPQVITDDEKKAKDKARRKRDKTAAKAAGMTVKDYLESKKGEENSKRRRFNPGTVSRREVTKLQKTTNLLMRKEPFRRVCKEVITDLTGDFGVVRFPEHAINTLQEFVEGQIVDLFHSAHKFSVHADRKSIHQKDLNLAWGCSSFSKSGSPQDSLSFKFEKQSKSSKKAASKSGKKVMRDAPQGLSNPGIERLARRGGVERLSAEVYENIRFRIVSMVTIIISNSLSIILSNKSKTITSEVIRLAARFLGFNLLVVEREKAKRSAKEKTEESEGSEAAPKAKKSPKAKAPAKPKAAPKAKKSPKPKAAPKAKAVTSRTRKAKA